MAKITKEMQAEIAEYCESLRAGLALRPAEYHFDPWKTVQIYEGAKFFCNDEATAYALYGFGDEISPECARKLGECHVKRVWSDHLAGVRFECKAKEGDLLKYMNGEAATPPVIHANCYKLIPIEREIFRTKEINEDGMFEIALTAGSYGKFDPPEDELPKKFGSMTLPLRIRLSGGLPTGPIRFDTVSWKHCRRFTFTCGGGKYGFLMNFGDRLPGIEVPKWRARKDEDGVYLDVILKMSFTGRTYFI